MTQTAAQVAPTRPTAMRRTWPPHPTLTRLGVIALLFAIWEVVARFFVDPLFLAPPSAVVASLGALLGRPGVPTAFAVTLGELVAAFALSVAIGGLVGLGIGLSVFGRRAILPIVLLAYAIPQVTILPVVILAFGIGPASKIVFGVTHGMFPIMVTVIAGVQTLPATLAISAASMGAGRWQRIRWVVLPHIVPSFFTGLRLAMSAVLLGVLLAELYASSRGIGHFTRLFTDTFDPASLFGLIAIVAAMAIGLNAGLRRLEARFSRWRL